MPLLDSAEVDKLPAHKRAWLLKQHRQLQRPEFDRAQLLKYVRRRSKIEASRLEAVAAAQSQDSRVAQLTADADKALSDVNNGDYQSEDEIEANDIEDTA